MKTTSLKSVLKLILISFISLTICFVLSTSFVNCAQGPLDDSFDSPDAKVQVASLDQPECFEGVLCVGNNTASCFDRSKFYVNEQSLVCFKPKRQ